VRACFVLRSRFAEDQLVFHLSPEVATTRYFTVR
jgi:hypothetical protein